jgi:hypothetical protein
MGLLRRLRGKKHDPASSPGSLQFTNPEQPFGNGEEKCVFCSGRGRIFYDPVWETGEAQICPICKGAGKVTRDDPYYTSDGFLSVKLAQLLITNHGQPTEIYLVDTGSPNLVDVRIVFRDGSQYRLGGFAVGYSGTRPDLLVRLLKASGFSTSPGDVEKMKTPSTLLNQTSGPEILVENGLVWQAQCDGVERTQAEALDYCRGLSLAGYRDWRLPTLEEFKRLGRNLEESYPDYWTATDEPRLDASVAYISDGTTMFRTNKYYVRAVRDLSYLLVGQTDSDHKSDLEYGDQENDLKGEANQPPPAAHPVPTQTSLIQYESSRDEINPGDSTVQPGHRGEHAAQKPAVREERLSTRPLSPAPLPEQGTEANAGRPSPHDQPGRNRSKKEPHPGPNPLRRLLTIVITLAGSFLVTILCILPYAPMGASTGTGDVVDLAGNLGTLAGGMLGSAILVGSIANAIISRLFPEKPVSPGIAPANSSAGQTAFSTLPANGPEAGSALVVKAPRRRSAAGRIVRVILLLILLGIAGAIWLQTTETGAGLRSLFASRATDVSPKPKNSHPPAGQASSIMGCVTGSSLRVRTGPGTDYPVKSGLSRGDCVAFDARNDSSTWIRLAPDEEAAGQGQAGDGKRLWVSADYIKLEESIEDLPVAAAPGK